MDKIDLLIKKLGMKRDGRKKYKIIDNHVCEIVAWTDSCTGCYESEDGHPVGDYPIDLKHNCYIGSGCFECGYTGKRRIEMWVPMIKNVRDLV